MLEYSPTEIDNRVKLSVMWCDVERGEMRLGWYEVEKEMEEEERKRGHGKMGGLDKAYVHVHVCMYVCVRLKG